LDDAAIADRARAFAADSGILCILDGGRLPTGRPDSFESDPQRDFGGLYEGRAQLVFCPRSLDQAQAVLRFLYAESIPYKLRGSAHTPGGEVLSTGGAVVELRGLSGLAYRPGADEVTVLAGTHWLTLCQQLAPQQRAPRVLTDNPYTTLAGTLSVGGFGDSSHIYGLQSDCVRRATLLLPTGERRDVTSSDPLLRYALCGHGQLGLLAEVTLPLWRRSHALHGCLLHFADAARFAQAAIRIGEERRCDYVRARAHGVPPHAVTAFVGRYDAELPTAALRGLPVSDHSDMEWVDFLAHWGAQGLPSWRRYNPALEVVLPLPSGLTLLAELDELARGLGRNCLPRGYSLLVLRGRGASLLPLSPLPDTPWALIAALRPECQTLPEAQAIGAQLVPLARRVIAAGGTLYLSSFPLDPDLVQAQLGPDLATLRQLKQTVDPAGLCNPGALFGYPLSTLPTKTS
jgi:FAD/FMN-containing dehydrogenase